MEDAVKLQMYDKTKVVVVDFGQKYTKIGVGGEPNPRFIVPSAIPDISSKTLKPVFDTKDSEELYDNLVEFVHFLYFKRLLINPRDTKIVIVESLLCPSAIRITLAKVLFNHLQVPAALFVPSHMVALYTLAAPTALSIDLGYVETCVVPVYHGYPVLNAYQVQTIGGRAIEMEIRSLLETYYKFKDPVRVPEVRALPDEVIEEIKVALCFVAPFDKVSRPDKETTRPPDVAFPIPGAPSLVIPGSIREDACEVLFKTDIDGVCLPSMALDAILKCPLDMRRPLAEGLFLFGGTAMIRGLRKRLYDEIKKLLELEPYKTKLHIETVKMFTVPSQDNYTAWLGGAILGATETVATRATTKEKFSKEGDIPDWANLKYNTRKDEICTPIFPSRVL